MNYRILDEPFPLLDGPPRSPGLHLTNIIKDMLPDRSTDNELWKEPGFIWVVLLSLAFGQRMPNRPGEITLDGIAMSPDGMDWDAWVVHEYKCTWKSVRKEPMDDAYYMMQAMGYCKGLGAKTVVMRMLYLMGDYRGSGPQYKVYEIVFSERELEENWEAILNHAKFRGWL